MSHVRRRRVLASTLAQSPPCPSDSPAVPSGDRRRLRRWRRRGPTEITYLIGDGGGTAVPFGEALTEKFKAEPGHQGHHGDPAGRHRGRQPDEDQARHRRDGRRLPLQLRLAVPGPQPGQEPGAADRRGVGGDLPEEFKSVVSTADGPYGAPTAPPRPAACSTTRRSTRASAWRSRRPGRSSRPTTRRSRPTARSPDPADLRRDLDLAAVRARRLRQRGGAGPGVGRPVHRQQAQVRRPAGAAELREPAGDVRGRLLQQELRLGDVRRRHQGDRHRHGGALPDADQRALAIQQNYPDNLDDVGFFALPAQDAADTRDTIWLPNALYIPKTTEGAKLEAAKKFVAFANSPEGCEIQATIGTAPARSRSVLQAAGRRRRPGQGHPDLRRDGKSGLALEFLSPIKGPNLERITVEVGSGIRSAEEGAKLYDEDVKKQAQQLGLPGW